MEEEHARQPASTIPGAPEGVCNLWDKKVMWTEKDRSHGRAAEGPNTNNFNQQQAAQQSQEEEERQSSNARIPSPESEMRQLPPQRGSHTKLFTSQSRESEVNFASVVTQSMLGRCNCD